MKKIMNTLKAVARTIKTAANHAPERWTLEGSVILSDEDTITTIWSAII